MAVKIDKGSSQELNLTPMIDLVFNLLIFFMVATEFHALVRRRHDAVSPPPG